MSRFCRSVSRRKLARPRKGCRETDARYFLRISSPVRPGRIGDARRRRKFVSRKSARPTFNSSQIVYDVNSVGGSGVASSHAGQCSRPALPIPSQPAAADRLGSASKSNIRIPGVHPDFVHVTLRVLTPGSNANDLAFASGPPPGSAGLLKRQ